LTAPTDKLRPPQTSFIPWPPERSTLPAFAHANFLIATEPYFWIRLREVIKSSQFDSNNYDLIKQTTQELLDIKVVAETDTTWTSERLLSGAKIHNTKGLRSQGGEVWIGFAFPREVMQMVLNPNTYTKFSLRFQTALRGNGSLGLYEIARRYPTSPSHLTYRDNWEKWYQAITGTSITETIPEYKYFKRDTLKKAIAEINSVTDITVELIEHAKGLLAANQNMNKYGHKHYH
jgi:plasmid replication initiation protein